MRVRPAMDAENKNMTMPPSAAASGRVAGHCLTPADVGLPPGTHRRGLDALDDGHEYWIDDIRGDIPATFSG